MPDFPSLASLAVSMSGTQLVFSFFFGVAVLSAILAVTLRNVMHSALSLAASLVGVAGIFVMLQAEFLAAVQVILYAGGIMVLIVFAIMMIQRLSGDQHAQTNDQWLVALGVCAVLIIVLSNVIDGTTFSGPDASHDAAATSEERTAPADASSGDPRSPGPVPNVHRLGELLLFKYMVPFELASVVLLTAMVGVIVIAKRD